MSEPSLLSVVANLLRPVSKDVSKGNGKLCLSTVYLNKLNKAFDENMPEDLTSSFHLTEAKASLQVDLQFLLDLVKGTIALKISPDLTEDEDSKVANLRRFQNIKSLEIHKIDVQNVIGIQKLRSHMEDLTSMYNLENLGDILDKCGGDYSHKYNWSELKRVNFSHNCIKYIDTSFESTPWLQTLDLSHNQIRDLEFTDNLPNLKRLNLSYNKLEKVPRFKGHICKRLQVLLLNNNFIEDISGLATLSDLLQLDLAQNCLMDHKSLLSISQMSSLYSLNLQGNPVGFHPLHRTVTCNYLNKNIATLNFVLDNISLTKIEKSLSGSNYILSQNSMGSNMSNSSMNSLENLMQDRPKKVKNVTMQEGYEIKTAKERKKSDYVTPSPRSNDTSHLDVKNQIEQLRQEYGEGWLSHQSGGILQTILKYPEASKPTTSSPLTYEMPPSPSNESDHTENPDSFVPEPESHDDKPKQEDKEESIDSSSDEDADGEIFIGGTNEESFDLCIAVTDKHLSERDGSTMKEKARWHINVIKSCVPGENPNEVNIVFNTYRTDRKSRTYFMEDAETFVKLIFDGMIRNKVPENRIRYQCIKCNNVFSRLKEVLEEDKVTCPKCDSNLVVESK